MILIGDFNAKSLNWYKNDKCSFEGSIIENATSQFGLQQAIMEQTDIFGNSSTCIILNSTSQAILLIESIVYASLLLKLPPPDYLFKI